MAKKLGSVLGIDIGSHSIKVCEIKLSGRGATVSAVGVVPTPEGSVDHSGVYNPEAVGAALKQAISLSGATSPMAVLSISGQQSVLVRVLEVPRMDPDKELASHMEWEINKNIPFSETTIMSDYKVVASDDPASADMDVVMAMSPQSAIDTLVECIKKAGKKPFAIDVPPLGLVRALSTSVPEISDGRGTCIVDIGHLSTQINIYRGGNLVLPRPVPGGSSHITQAIADALQMGMADAETYKLDQFTIHSGASAGSGAGYDPYGGATQAFGSYEFNPTDGYQAAGPGDNYDPGATISAPAGSLVSDAVGAVVDPITGLAVSGAQAYEVAVDPITGLAIEVTGAFDAVKDGAENATDLFSAPTYGNDPFGGTTSGAAADVNATQALNPDWAPAAMSGSTPVAASGPEDPAFGSVNPVLEELVSEIRRSIDYYSGKGGSVSRIVICGGGSKLKGLDGYIGRSLSINCERFDPLKNLGLAPKKVGMDYVNEHKEQIALAVGNGLHILFE